MKSASQEGFALPLWELPSVDIAGSGQRYPVRRIHCSGGQRRGNARAIIRREVQPLCYLEGDGNARVVFDARHRLFADDHRPTVWETAAFAHRKREDA